MKNIKTDSKKIAEAIESANSVANAAGMEKVVWANKLTSSARKVSYGFNFQPVGTVKVGEYRENQWAGIADQAFGNVCQAVAII